MILIIYCLELVLINLIVFFRRRYQYATLNHSHIRQVEITIQVIQIVQIIYHPDHLLIDHLDHIPAFYEMLCKNGITQISTGEQARKKSRGTHIIAPGQTWSTAADRADDHLNQG